VQTVHTPQCTLYHILCNCPFSLKHQRYEWRHDSVLRTIAQTICKRIEDQNTKQPKSRPTKITFVAAGSRPTTRRDNTAFGLLCCANDWKLLVDYTDKPIIFPPNITATDQRPDIVIWSDTVKSAILIELTVPCEDNIVDAEFRKKNKYGDLVESCRLAGWETTLMTVEVGARGFVEGSLRKCLMYRISPLREPFHLPPRPLYVVHTPSTWHATFRLGNL